MKILGDMNNERFLKEAFDPERNRQHTKAACLRRNIYCGLFLAGIICIFITAFINQILLATLSLGLALLSLVVMTKYDTQISFLRSIRRQQDQPGASDTELIHPDLRE